MTAAERLDAIAVAYIEHDEFRPVEINLDAETVPRLVKLAKNPVRFLPKIFDEDWAVLGVHPTVGHCRVLRVIVDNESIVQVIVRQGRSLFVYTFGPKE